MERPDALLGRPAFLIAIATRYLGVALPVLVVEPPIVPVVEPPIVPVVEPPMVPPGGVVPVDVPVDIEPSVLVPGIDVDIDPSVLVPVDVLVDPVLLWPRVDLLFDVVAVPVVVDWPLVPDMVDPVSVDPIDPAVLDPVVPAPALPVVWAVARVGKINAAAAMVSAIRINSLLN